MKFNNIWSKHKEPLANFITSKVPHPDIVDDLMQDISLKLWDNIERGTTIRNYEKWIFQVARNTIADYYRKRSKQSPQNQVTLNAEIPYTNCVCDLSGFVIERYLPKEYSTPLYLSDIEKVPQKKIAETLNLSVTATKSRIQRGRKKLRKLILDCVDLSYNDRGQITEYKLKETCNLPPELLAEIEKLKLSF